MKLSSIGFESTYGLQIVPFSVWLRYAVRLIQFANVVTVFTCRLYAVFSLISSFSVHWINFIFSLSTDLSSNNYVSLNYSGTEIIINYRIQLSQRITQSGRRRRKRKFTSEEQRTLLAQIKPGQRMPAYLTLISSKPYPILYM